MHEERLSLFYKLVLLYMAVALLLRFAFGVDILGWWLEPLQDGFHSLIQALDELALLRRNSP